MGGWQFAHLIKSLMKAIFLGAKAKGSLDVKVKVKVKAKKLRNKLGLNWAKLSSNWKWTLILVELSLNWPTGTKLGTSALFTIKI